MTETTIPYMELKELVAEYIGMYNCVYGQFKTRTYNIFETNFSQFQLEYQKKIIIKIANASLCVVAHSSSNGHPPVWAPP